VLASATADASGSLTATAPAPQSAYNYRIFLGLGARSGKLGAAGFLMTPELDPDPGFGAPRHYRYCRRVRLQRAADRRHLLGQ
jgi:hypothetical protein